MKQHPVVYRYKNWDVTLVLSHYADDLARSAIQLVAADTERNRQLEVYPGEPIATATVNIPLAPLQHEQTLIKSWSENEGMLEWLYTHGLVEPTGQFVESGFVSADVVWLTQKLGDVAEVLE